MEGRFRLLLVAGLLASLLPAVSWPQPGGPCEATLLATQVALFCGAGVPSPGCCYSLLASVDIGGGVPCLCRLGEEPQLVMAGLNAVHLLTLYTSCGGLRPGGEGAHLAAACEGPAPPAAADVSSPPPLPAPRRKSPGREAPPPPSSTEKPSLLPQQDARFRPGDEAPPPAWTNKPSPPTQKHNGFFPSGAHLAAGCEAPPSDVSPPPPVARSKREVLESVCEDSFMLARQLMTFCAHTEDSPMKTCCTQVIRTVDSGCLCEVGEEPVIMTSSLDASHLWYLYGTCGGKHSVPTDRTSCDIIQSPPQSPPPPNSSPPPNARTTTSPPTQSLDEPMLQSFKNLYKSLTLTSICLGASTVGLILAATAAVVAIWRKSKNASVAPAPPPAATSVAIKSKSPVSSKAKSKTPEKVQVPSARKPMNASPQAYILPEPPPTGPTPSAPPVELMELC